jgi:hypothetical protein
MREWGFVEAVSLWAWSINPFIQLRVTREALDTYKVECMNIVDENVELKKEIARLRAAQKEQTT